MAAGGGIAGKLHDRDYVGRVWEKSGRTGVQCGKGRKMGLGCGDEAFESPGSQPEVYRDIVPGLGTGGRFLRWSRTIFRGYGLCSVSRHQERGKDQVFPVCSE